MPRRQDGSSKYPATSITVHLDSHTSEEIPLSCIRSITPPDEDGLIDVVYSASVVFKDGYVVNELRLGESTIDSLLCALGWLSDSNCRADLPLSMLH
jgi:hypothetical protein